MSVMGFQAVNSCAAKRGCPLLPSGGRGVLRGTGTAPEIWELPPLTAEGAAPFELTNLFLVSFSVKTHL